MSYDAMAQAQAHSLAPQGYQNTVQQRPTPQIIAQSSECLSQSHSIRMRLGQVLDRLRVSPPQAVGHGGLAGAIEAQPPLSAVINRIGETQRECLELMNEIESFV